MALKYVAEPKVFQRPSDHIFNFECDCNRENICQDWESIHERRM